MRSLPLTVLLWALALRVMGAGPTQLPSLASPPSPPSRSASGASSSPKVSGDGQTVVFASKANNLAPGDTNGAVSDIFARDLAANTTELLSVTPQGVSGNGPSFSPVVSSNGRFVAFVSGASNLVTNDTNDAPDIFLRDRVAAVTTLISIARNGAGSGSGPSDSPILTPDGRFVGFQSWATNLVQRDVNGLPDLFLRDLQSGITTRISIPSTEPLVTSLSSGASRALALSADGSRAVFLSDARNLAPAPRGNTTTLHVRDLAAGTTRMIDLLPPQATRQKTTVVGNPTLSADGLWVAVYVQPPAAFGPPGMVRIHLGTPATTLERIAPSLNTRTPFPIGSDSSGPCLSEDGQTVVFEARRGSPSNSVDQSTVQASPAVYAWTPGSEPTLISTNIALAEVSVGPRPLGELLATSDTTEFVAFSGYQPSAIEPTLRSPLNLWVVHRPTLETRRLTRAEFSDDGPQPSFSADGRRVAFVSADSGLVPEDLNNASDVFLYDWNSGQLELVSVRADSLPSGTGAFPSVGARSGLSADGNQLVFSSVAPLGPDPDTNDAPDLFVWDLPTQTTRLASGRSEALGTGNGASLEPNLSGNGRWLAFLSTSTNLAGPPGNGAENVYLRDLVNGTTRLASIVAATGQPSPLPCSQPALSPDGRFIAFITRAALVPEDLRSSDDLYLFDRDSGTVQLITTNAVTVAPLSGLQGSANPRWTSDGRWIVFESLAHALTDDPIFGSGIARWYARDMTRQTTRLLSDAGIPNVLTEESLGAALSGDGTTVAFSGSSPGTAGVTDILVRHLESWEITASVTNALRPRLDRAAQRLAYRSRPSSSKPGTNAVRVLHIPSGESLPVDVAPDGTPPSALTRSFELDPDGRFVFFTSAATNLHPAARNGHTQLFARDLVARTTLLLSVNAEGHAADSAIGNFVVSGDGRTLAFTTFAANLAPTDLNQTADVYLVRLDSNPGGDAPVLSITRAGAETHDVILLWSSTPGVRYRAEYKASLDDPSWTEVAPAEVAAGSQSTLLDRSAATESRRFYRVVRE